MIEETRDRVATNLLALMPFYHKHVFKPGCAGVTGIQLAQYRVLGILMKSGPLSMSEIGRRLYISKPYMTALVDTLIREGFLERGKDATDRRIINISITPIGRKYLDAFLHQFKNDLKKLLSDLNDEDVDLLCESLDAIKRILAKIP